MGGNSKSSKYQVAQELANMYCSMKQMSSRLAEIIEEYSLEELEGLFQVDIARIEECDHSLLSLAHKLAHGPSLKVKNKGEKNAANSK
jgi:hypothetical protein